jgi:hypothetical protein
MLASSSKASITSHARSPAMPVAPPNTMRALIRTGHAAAEPRTAR